MNAVAVLEGDRIVSASNDNTLKVWSLTPGECFQTLTGHSGPVNAVAVLEDDRIVSASNELKVWSLTPGECLQTLPGHSGPVCAVAALGCDRIVSGSCDNTRERGRPVLREWCVIPPMQIFWCAIRCAMSKLQGRPHGMHGGGCPGCGHGGTQQARTAP